MVEQPSSWTNRAKLLDSFEFIFDLNLVDREIWADLYQIRGLSAAQIARLYRSPKSTILSILHHHGLRCRSAEGRSTRVDNYRAPVPPYGYKVTGGKLVESSKERAVCELISTLAKAGKSWTEIAEELNRRQILTRRAKSCWHRHTVRIIFQRYNGSH